jgi:oligoendopeptidase F
VRTPEVEEVLALAHEATGGTSTVFKLFNDADLKFPNVRDDEGKDAELTHGRYIKFLESQKRDVREGAFKTMHGEYSKWRNTLAASLSGAVKANVFNARVRKYESALHAALSPDEIPTEVYTNLIGAVRERCRFCIVTCVCAKRCWAWTTCRCGTYTCRWSRKSSARFLTKKPSVRSRNRCSRWANSTASTRPRLQRALDRRAGKRRKTSGAFSDGAYTTPPYILMNWQDNLNNAFTLTHELGHSLHSHFTRETQPYVYSHYTIFVAEVASR